MSASRYSLAIAILGLPVLASLAFVAAGPAKADPPQGNLKLGPIACDTPHHLYNILNAATRRDSLRIAHLEADGCEALAGHHYEVVREMNGMTQIRIFAAEGDWANSRLAYTLDEMVAPNAKAADASPPTG